MLRRRGEGSEENFDAIGLLQTLCLVKMDGVDGSKTAARLDQAKTNATDAAANDGAAKNSPKSAAGNNTHMETEMKGEKCCKSSLSTDILVSVCTLGVIRNWLFPYNLLLYSFL